MKTYHVSGGAPFLGHEPGETFTANLNPTFEKRVIARGSIELVDEAGDTLWNLTDQTTDPDSLDIGNGADSVSGGKE